MLSGKDLGRAIEQAINKKKASGAIKSKADVAHHFKIKAPSIYDWIKKGSISKEKLPELWNYFSDVVGPEHWGLHEFPLKNIGIQKLSDPQDNDIVETYHLASEERQAVVDFLLSRDDDVAWVDADARAYVDSLDAKARRWIDENRPEHKKKTLAKNGN
jgi:hypothetical protein